MIEVLSDLLLPAAISFITAIKTAEYKMKEDKKNQFVKELETIIEKATVLFRTPPDDTSERIAIVLGASVRRIPTYFSEKRRNKPDIAEAIASFRIAVMQDSDDRNRKPLAEDNIKFTAMREKAEKLKSLL